MRRLLRAIVPTFLVLWCTGMGWLLAWLLVQVWPGAVILGMVLVGLSGLAGFRVADTYCRTRRLREEYAATWRALFGTSPPV